MISELIHRIGKLQSAGSAQFAEGIFPSWRRNRFFLYKRADDNIFTTVSTLFILKEMRFLLTASDLNAVNEIIEKGKKSFVNYRNKDGMATYNFWKSKPSHYFPNGILMHRFLHFRVPDDIDDTSLIYLVKDAERKEVQWLKEKLKEHCTSSLVYDTWFGLNMPKEQDVCALCNLMFLLISSGLPKNEFDKATLNYLNAVIVSGQYRSNAFWMARHYGTTALIVYHYARLLGSLDIEELAEAKALFIDEIPELIDQERSRVNQMIIETAFMKLTQEKSRFSLGLKLDEILSEKSFYPFIGSLLAPLGSSFLNKLAPHKWTWIGWDCPSYVLALLAENEAYKERFK